MKNILKIFIIFYFATAFQNKECLKSLVFKPYRCSSTSGWDFKWLSGFLVLYSVQSIHLYYILLVKPAQSEQALVSQSHMGYLTSKLNYRRFPSYLLCTLLLFPFHILPSPVHPIGFSFCFFPGLLAIFTLLSSNNKQN